MAKNTAGKEKFAAIDVFIIILLLVCVAGIAVRIAVGQGGLFSTHEGGDYIVSYMVTGVGGEKAEYFADGVKLYAENGELFGTFTGDPSYTPAKLYSENADGEYIVSYATDGRVDVKGTVKCRGTMSDSGFLLGGKTYLAANSTLTVSSTDLTVEITVTDIAKAQ